MYIVIFKNIKVATAAACSEEAQERAIQTVESLGIMITEITSIRRI